MLVFDPTTAYLLDQAPSESTTHHKLLDDSKNSAKMSLALVVAVVALIMLTPERPAPGEESTLAQASKLDMAFPHAQDYSTKVMECNPASVGVAELGAR